MYNYDLSYIITTGFPARDAKVSNARYNINFGAVVDTVNRGLGEVICLKFAREGCNIAINYMSSADRAQDLAKKIESESGVKVALVQGVGFAFSFPEPWRCTWLKYHG